MAFQLWTTIGQTHSTTYPASAVAGQMHFQDTAEQLAVRVVEAAGSYWEII